tara:strand:- start:3437 stop:3748 length:312 start_codon:yes stop_codon:yes gene_type:complete
MAWTILNMEHKTSDGFVIEVTSAYEKQDGPGYASELFLNEFEEVVGPDFIPYEDLTEDLVIGWVKDALGSEAVAKTELDVNTLAATKKQDIENPAVEGGLPWG